MGTALIPPPPPSRPRLNTEHLRLVVTDKELPRHVANGFMRYDNFHKFTEGGTAVLEECLDKNLGRNVLMKRLHPDLNDDPIERRRFLREARVTALIQHPGTVPVYEISRDNLGQIYFTMKKVEGDSLREILLGIVARDPYYRGKYSLKYLIEVLMQVGQAVAFAHSRGVVHRDLKPANILVGEFGEVMVIDWGLSKVLDEPDTFHGEVPERDPIDLELTRAGNKCGTPLYMSPEQAAGQTDKVDGRSDVYSLGSILYEVLTHENLVWGATREEVLKKILEQDPMPPRKRAPQRRIPPELDSICLHAVQRDPEKRYQSLLAMSDDLKGYLRHEPVSAHRYSPWERFINWEQRHTLLTVGIGSAVLGICLTLILQLLIK
jgi:serine/threonine-protein kinase